MENNKDIEVLLKHRELLMGVEIALKGKEARHDNVKGGGWRDARSWVAELR